MDKYRSLYHSLTIDEKVAFISRLSKSAFIQFRYHSDLMLREKQIVPDTWHGRYYIALCGRGWGKTKMGAYWIKQKVYAQKSSKARLAIVAPTHKDLERVMVPAIQDEFPPDQKPVYVGGDNSTITCHNGVIIDCFTASTEIRGGNYVAVWCDELAKWCDSIPEKAEKSFEILNYACRKGNAQFLITTTPKPWPIFYKWRDRAIANDKGVCIVTGSMEDNDFLSQAAKDELYAEYSHSRSGQQELEGVLLEAIEGALWSWDMIAAAQYPQDINVINSIQPLFPKTPDGFYKEWLIKIVVSVDPAGSANKTSDETGIMVVGLSNTGHAYVLEDGSGRYTPPQWASKAIDLYKKYQANTIIAEKNFGGDMVEHTLRMVDPHLPIKLNTASRGKDVRAEPISVRYKNAVVHHVVPFKDGAPIKNERFKKLEQQMIIFTGDPNNNDDRVDALVWALDELLVQKTIQKRSIINLPNWS